MRKKQLQKILQLVSERGKTAQSKSKTNKRKWRKPAAGRKTNKTVFYLTVNRRSNGTKGN